MGSLRCIIALRLPEILNKTPIDFFNCNIHACYGANQIYLSPGPCEPRNYDRSGSVIIRVFEPFRCAMVALSEFSRGGAAALGKTPVLTPRRCVAA